MKTGVCPVAGCDRHLAPAKPFCYAHWFRVPPEQQQHILDMQRRLMFGHEQELFGLDYYDGLIGEAVALLTPPEPEPLE